jgi:hypothetical protein
MKYLLKTPLEWDLKAGVRFVLSELVGKSKI